MELPCHQMKYHWVPYNSLELWCRQMKYHLDPWNSMELCDCYVANAMLPWTCMGYLMEFYGTLESPNKKSPSSIGFHGIRRAQFQMTQVFHWIPWNIPWNSMELWYRQMKYSLVPWNSMEYSMEFQGTLVPPNEISLSFMQFHGTLRSSFYSIPCYPVLWSRQIKYPGVPCNFMEIEGRCCKRHKSSMEFHGILESPYRM